MLLFYSHVIHVEKVRYKQQQQQEMTPTGVVLAYTSNETI